MSLAAADQRPRSAIIVRDALAYVLASLGTGLAAAVALAAAVLLLAGSAAATEPNSRVGHAHALAELSTAAQRAAPDRPAGAEPAPGAQQWASRVASRDTARPVSAAWVAAGACLVLAGLVMVRLPLGARRRTAER